MWSNAIPVYLVNCSLNTGILGYRWLKWFNRINFAPIFTPLSIASVVVLKWKAKVKLKFYEAARNSKWCKGNSKGIQSSSTVIPGATLPWATHSRLSTIPVLFSKSFSFKVIFQSGFMNEEISIFAWREHNEINVTKHSSKRFGPILAVLSFSLT